MNFFLFSKKKIYDILCGIRAYVNSLHTILDFFFLSFSSLHEAMTTTEALQSSGNQSSESSTLISTSNSPSNTSVSLFNNICNLVSMRLDSMNYVLWRRFQISPLLKSHKLFKYVDGTIKAPEAIL